jgi:hypothetical protein
MRSTAKTLLAGVILLRPGGRWRTAEIDLCQSLPIFAGDIGLVHIDDAGRRASVVFDRRSTPMWILMYVFSYSVSPAATDDKTEWRLLPTVVFQEFSNEERCSAPRRRSLRAA